MEEGRRGGVWSSECLWPLHRALAEGSPMIDSNDRVCFCLQRSPCLRSEFGSRLEKLSAIRSTNSRRYLSKREQLAWQTQRINDGGPVLIWVSEAAKHPAHVALTLEEMHLSVRVLKMWRTEVVWLSLGSFSEIYWLCLLLGLFEGVNQPQDAVDWIINVCVCVVGKPHTTTTGVWFFALVFFKPPLYLFISPSIFLLYFLLLSFMLIWSAPLGPLSLTSALACDHGNMTHTLPLLCTLTNSPTSAWAHVRERARASAALVTECFWQRGETQLVEDTARWGCNVCDQGLLPVIAALAADNGKHACIEKHTRSFCI